MPIFILCCIWVVYGCVFFVVNFVFIWNVSHTYMLQFFDAMTTYYFSSLSFSLSLLSPSPFSLPLPSLSLSLLSPSPFSLPLPSLSLSLLSPSPFSLPLPSLSLLLSLPLLLAAPSPFSLPLPSLSLSRLSPSSSLLVSPPWWRSLLSLLSPCGPASRPHRGGGSHSPPEGVPLPFSTGGGGGPLALFSLSPSRSPVSLSLLSARPSLPLLSNFSIYPLAHLLSPLLPPQGTATTRPHVLLPPVCRPVYTHYSVGSSVTGPAFHWIFPSDEKFKSFWVLGVRGTCKFQLRQTLGRGAGRVGGSAFEHHTNWLQRVRVRRAERTPGQSLWRVLSGDGEGGKGLLLVQGVVCVFCARGREKWLCSVSVSLSLPSSLLHILFICLCEYCSFHVSEFSALFLATNCIQCCSPGNGSVS